MSCFKHLIGQQVDLYFYNADHYTSFDDADSCKALYSSVVTIHSIKSLNGYKTLIQNASHALVHDFGNLIISIKVDNKHIPIQEIIDSFAEPKLSLIPKKKHCLTALIPFLSLAQA